MPKQDPIMKVDVLPFPKAAIVKYVRALDEDGEKDNSYAHYIGQRFLIAEIGEEGEYSILGHSEIGTQGRGSAWHHHNCFELVEEPSLKSWGMLFGVASDEEDDQNDDDDDQNDDDDDQDDDDDDQDDDQNDNDNSRDNDDDEDVSDRRLAGSLVND